MTLESSRQEKLEDVWRARGSAAFDESEQFKHLQAYCAFVGQSRSGHSVVGTIVNAHRHAVVSHNLDAFDYLQAGVEREDLFQLILAHDLWLAGRDRWIGGYSYDVSGLWLGNHDEIHVIGDKRAGATSRHLAKDPTLLKKLSAAVGLPICVIHHVRNPWDNISSIWTAKTLGKERTLSEATDHYFEMLDGAALGLSAAEGEVRLLRTFHEDLILNPKPVIAQILKALNLSVDEDFLSVCAAFVHTEPRRTRNNAPWTADLIQHVADRMRAFDFLDRYAFDAA